MKQLLLLVALLSTTGIYAGEVYKWKDADGNVHFSAHPPTEENKTLEIKQYKGAQPAGQHMDEAREIAEAMKNELKKVDETSKKLDCSAAISNADWQFETMFTQAKRNLNNGTINHNQYNQATSALQEARTQVSFSRCQSASGTERSFYECMSNNNNHLIGCRSKYEF